MVTFDGWKERIWRDDELILEKNNFIMVRPEGNVVIGADANGENFFTGYISELTITPYTSIR